MGCLTAEEMRALEMNSEYLGLSRVQMMENAGRGVAEEVLRRFKPPCRVLFFCGTGGNGGDGFVAARHLAASGFDVEVVLVGDESEMRGEEVKRNWEILKSMRSSIRLRVVRDSSGLLEVEGAEVIVDALVGTGIRGTLRPPVRQAVEAINGMEGFKVSVDIPSGLEADTGEVLGATVRADLTVTFHCEKPGFQRAEEYLGEVIVKPIGVPREALLYAGPGDVYLVSEKRRSDAHKGECGRVLVVGGSDLYSGAPALTALAAYRAGVDLVYVAAPEPAAHSIAEFSPSLITLKLRGDFLSPSNQWAVRPFLERVDAVAIGPGLGRREETFEAVKMLLEAVEEARLPVLLDADAIKAFAGFKRRLDTPAVFTPHRGEFKTLTGKDLPTKLDLMGEVVKEEAQALGATILLKGPVDVISDGSEVKFNWTGNPGMTVGGTGDVLSGIVVALMAKGFSPFRSAVAGAFVNGAAGDFAYSEKGFHLLPTDLLEWIPVVLEDPMSHREVREGGI
ncbi:bifunctional ADP-dependent NAD(P)H-hydrate dehydratase/NAD(P)H-hydrate epimerase [Candidatus Bathyarchaeota archaeon]|nr:MAG: bifunctional ADP-dependent NAD(P)H-hydrate dehydratase/NAD(P)H-hydrate epimerase [Candidatus Bathyarchaeota archaeon]